MAQDADVGAVKLKVSIGGLRGGKLVLLCL